MRKLNAGILAGVLVAGMAWAGGSPTARADYQSDRDALCGPGETNACSVDILNDGLYELTEGVDSATVDVTGTPGITSSLQMYALVPSEFPYSFDEIQAYGPPVAFTTDVAGEATVTVPIVPLEAPYGASTTVAFQLPGSTPDFMAGRPIGSPALGGFADQIRVRSTRGFDRSGMERVIDGSLEARVEGGLPGDVYGVEIEIGGTWSEMPNLDVVDNGKVGSNSFAVVHADVSGYPDGTYSMRAFNRTRGIHDLHIYHFQGLLTLKKSVYITPGEHMSGGRKWRTACEPYSATERCRTEIWSTEVVYRAGKLVKDTGWHFNNLTYKPSPRSLWAGNPLGNAGSYVISGRQWRTECDTPVTGGNGCRSYIVSDVVQATKTGNSYTYAMVHKEVFNNIVMSTTS